MELRSNARIDEILECGFRYAKYKLCLRYNRTKDEPRYTEYKLLLLRLKQEVGELEEAIDSLLNAHNNLEEYYYRLEKVALEAADVINFASMICDKTEAEEF